MNRYPDEMATPNYVRAALDGDLPKISDRRGRKTKLQLTNR